MQRFHAPDGFIEIETQALQAAVDFIAHPLTVGLGNFLDPTVLHEAEHGAEYGEGSHENPGEPCLPVYCQVRHARCMSLSVYAIVAGLPVQLKAGKRQVKDVKKLFPRLTRCRRNASLPQETASDVKTRTSKTTNPDRRSFLGAGVADGLAFTTPGAVALTPQRSADPCVVHENTTPARPGFYLLAFDNVAAVRVDGSYVGPENLVVGAVTTPARPGDVISLFGAGFGPVDAEIPKGVMIPVPPALLRSMRINVGAAPVEVPYGGVTSAGLYQFNIVVPNLPDGDHPVLAAVAGVRMRKMGRLRVARATSGAQPRARSVRPLRVTMARFQKLIELSGATV